MCVEYCLNYVIIIIKRPSHSTVVDLVEVLGCVILRYDLNASMNEIVLN